MDSEGAPYTPPHCRMSPASSSKTVSSKCLDNSFTLYLSGAFVLCWLLMTSGKSHCNFSCLATQVTLLQLKQQTNENNSAKNNGAVKAQ